MRKAPFKNLGALSIHMVVVSMCPPSQLDPKSRKPLAKPNHLDFCLPVLCLARPSNGRSFFMVPRQIELQSINDALRVRSLWLIQDCRLNVVRKGIERVLVSANAT